MLAVVVALATPAHACSPLDAGTVLATAPMSGLGGQPPDALPRVQVFGVDTLHEFSVQVNGAVVTGTVEQTAPGLFTFVPDAVFPSNAFVDVTVVPIEGQTETRIGYETAYGSDTPDAPEAPTVEWLEARQWEKAENTCNTDFGRSISLSATPADAAYEELGWMVVHYLTGVATDAGPVFVQPIDPTSGDAWLGGQFGNWTGDGVAFSEECFQVEHLDGFGRSVRSETRCVPEDLVVEGEYDGEVTPLDDDDDSAGCQHSPSAPLGAWLAVGLLGWTTRRRR